MAKWFVMSADGETLMRNVRGDAETLEFDDGRAACNCAASFLIPFSEHELPARRDLGEAIEEELVGDDRNPEEESDADGDITELSVVCVEKGVRIRMTREPLGITADRIV
jgi:hypothetical protein